MVAQQVRVVVASRIAWVDAVEALGDDVAILAGLDDDGRHAVQMALREGLSNAMVHGNEADEAKEVEVDFLLHPQGLEIRIRDEGPGFDSQTLPDPLAPQNLLSPRGRGVFLIRNYMDEVDLGRTHLRGAEIRMIKLRQAGDSKAGDEE